VRQSSGAFVSGPRAQKRQRIAAVQDASASASIPPRFVVRLCGRIIINSFHEPQRRAGILPAFVGNADGTEPLALARSPEQAGSLPYVERDASIPAVFDLFPVGVELEFRAVVWIVAAQTVHLSEVEILQLAVLAGVILDVVIPPAVTGFAGDIL